MLFATTMSTRQSLLKPYHQTSPLLRVIREVDSRLTIPLLALGSRGSMGRTRAPVSSARVIVLPIRLLPGLVLHVGPGFIMGPTPCQVHKCIQAVPLAGA